MRATLSSGTHAAASTARHSGAMDHRERIVLLAGRTLIIGSLIGAVCAMAILGWPDEVPPTRYSHPFGPTTFVVAQLVFAAQHLALTAGLLGLGTLVGRSATRTLMTGLVLAIIAMAALAVVELAAIGAVGWDEGSAGASVLDAGYAIASLLLGVGLVVAGVSLARGGQLPGRLGRSIVLVCGAYVFVPLLPALFAPMIVGRVAIGVWQLLFAGIGLVVVRAVRPPSERAAAVTA